MAIHIIRKSDPNVKKENSKLALVLAGGAISGGAFKVGGLKALNDFLVNRKVTDFDIYVGLSAGAFLGAPLAGGIPPEEMLASLDGKSKLFSQLAPFEMYRPNFLEFARRPFKFFYGHLTYIPGICYDLMSALPNLQKDFVPHLMALLKKPSYSSYEKLMSPFYRVAYTTRTVPGLGEMIPSGIFDNRTLEAYIRKNLKHNRMSNNFKVLKRLTGKSLYITAMNLDSAERVVFGPDEKNDITISEAIQASTAIPGFYRPARIKGIDYIDGGVQKTANIDIAFDKGADLAICYNPFRPLHNDVVVEYLREENRYVTKSKRISDRGFWVVLNQVFRTLLHSRLMEAVNAYRDDPNFKKDLVLIEPTDDDVDFFEINPMLFWHRSRSATLGFQTVSKSIEENFEPLSALLAHHGVQMSRDLIDLDNRRIKKYGAEDPLVMKVLEEKHPPKKGLRIVQGGR